MTDINLASSVAAHIINLCDNHKKGKYARIESFINSKDESRVWQLKIHINDSYKGNQSLQLFIHNKYVIVHSFSSTISKKAADSNKDLHIVMQAHDPNFFEKMDVWVNYTLNQLD